MMCTALNGGYKTVNKTVRHGPSAAADVSSPKISSQIFQQENGTFPYRLSVSSFRVLLEY